MKVYEKNGKHLVVLPSIPQWFIVDKFGLNVFSHVLDGKTFEDILEIYPNISKDELSETYYDLVDISKDHKPFKDSKIIERALTSRTTIAMISVTGYCNLKCPHCYIDACGSSEEELSLEEHKKIANQLFESLAVDNKVKYKVNLTGGEPFLNKDIIDIIKAYHNVGFDVTMSTNGLLIKERDMSILSDMNVALSISLDGSTSFTHDMIRGSGNFDKTISKIKLLIKSNVRVAINCLLHDKNMHELEKIIDLTYELGCSGFNPINLVQLGRACDSELNRASETEVFQRIAKHLVNNHNQIHLFSFSSLFSSLGAALLSGIVCENCGIGNRPCVYITELGEVYPCPNTQCNEFLLGNTREQSIKECSDINHPVLVNFRKLHVDTMNNTCSSCDVRYFCGGDCRGETYNVTNNINAPYVACKDRHDSLIELMWIVAENSFLFQERSLEYEKHIG